MMSKLAALFLFFFLEISASRFWNTPWHRINLQLQIQDPKANYERLGHHNADNRCQTPTVPYSHRLNQHIMTIVLLYRLNTKGIALFFFIMYGSTLSDRPMLPLHFPSASIHTPAALDGAEIAV